MCMYSICNIEYFNNIVYGSYSYKNCVSVRSRVSAFLKSLFINPLRNFVTDNPLTYNFIVDIPCKEDTYKLIAKYTIDAKNINIIDVLFYKL